MHFETIFGFKIWKKLFGGTVPPNNTLFGGTVPPNNTLFGGTLKKFKSNVFDISCLVSLKR